MKNRNTSVILIVILVAVAFLMRGKTTTFPATSEDTVNSLFDAATRGDSSAYLRLLAEPFRTSLENTQSQLGSDKFAQSLRDSVKGLNGLAMSRMAAVAPGTEALSVDLSFGDRIENQRFVLAEQSGGWIIQSIDKAAVRKPPIPYGTPVYDITEPVSAAASNTSSKLLPARSSSNSQ